MLRLSVAIPATLMAALVGLPVLAGANFAQLNLSPNFERQQARVLGHTGGSFSLSSLASRDYRNQPCIGFGDPEPDHIMVLEDNFESLRLQVNSGGNDTTILVQAPDGTIRCGDDTGSKKDASIEDINWIAGSHKVWIGSFEPSQSWDYRLSVRE